MRRWCDDLYEACCGDASPTLASFELAVETLKAMTYKRQMHFIGNGGSAAIASHMAIDFLNKSGFSTRCYNDSAALTCLSNDYGYEDVFERQLNISIRPLDVLVAISSSGESRNIVGAAKNCARRGATIMALTGFDPSNALRKVGDINFYVPSKNYGIVETAHLGILHALLEAVTA